MILNHIDFDITKKLGMNDKGRKTYRAYKLHHLIHITQYKKVFFALNCVGEQTNS